MFFCVTGNFLSQPGIDECFCRHLFPLGDLRQPAVYLFVNGDEVRPSLQVYIEMSFR